MKKRLSMIVTAAALAAGLGAALAVAHTDSHANPSAAAAAYSSSTTSSSTSTTGGGGGGGGTTSTTGGGGGNAPLVQSFNVNGIQHGNSVTFTIVLGQPLSQLNANLVLLKVTVASKHK